MSITKIKIGAGSALAAIAVATVLIAQHQSQTRLREENRSLHQLLDQDGVLIQENQRLSNLVAQASSLQPSAEEQLRELLRLRGEIGRLRQENQRMEKLQQENRQLRAAQAQPAPGFGSMPVDPKQTQLYTRVIRVDSKTLLSKFGNSLTAGNENAGEDTFHQAALQQLLKDLGIEIEPPASAYMDETNGTLIVRTSLENLDKIEQIVGTLNLGVK